MTLSVVGIYIFSVLLFCAVPTQSTTYSNVTCDATYCLPNGTVCTAAFLNSSHAEIGFDYAEVGDVFCCKNTSRLLVCESQLDIFDFRHLPANCPVGTFFEVSDLILVIIGGVDCVLMIIVTIFVIAHRNYLPLRVTNVPLMATSTFGAVMWFFATVITNEHFVRERDSFWAVCNLWSFWVQSALGLHLWVGCLLVKLYRLYKVFIKKAQEAASGKKPNPKDKGHTNFFLQVLIPVSPSVLICLAGTIANGSQYNGCEGGCSFAPPRFLWAGAILSLSLIYFIIFVYFAVRLRKIRDEFNEFKKVAISVGVVTGALVVFFAIQLAISDPTLWLPRFIQSMLVIIVISYYFWFTLAVPSWKCFVGDKAYLNDFERRFNRSLTEKPQSFFGKVRTKLMAVTKLRAAAGKEPIDSNATTPRSKRSSTTPYRQESGEVEMQQPKKRASSVAISVAKSEEAAKEEAEKTLDEERGESKELIREGEGGAVSPVDVSLSEHKSTDRLTEEMSNSEKEACV
mmetsp:Transcript_4324/g.8680  ORF Transcript_4324/g.8680 Transcript_4324/m.8680 type:complete len:513 (-) Transcript_4324:587-2125(-)|eukprot:CAMPEP_0113874910 /NCGR_PEP_ID=MMETSP0780_2-20120614/4618_1 /TAXON_ID=652834 /ORGANISM="Palpitomonas bilix" /LENGTH=512 /DNA_ID=CAMNT_0000860779 /DNA_START=154 /DNA_END=1692 /DNA_ORIENTATION=+ /assembly_acc=CAM_ASM_000599